MFVKFGVFLLLASACTAELCTPKQWYSHMKINSAYGGFGQYGMYYEDRYFYYDAENGRFLKQVQVHFETSVQVYEELGIYKDGKGTIYLYDEVTQTCNVHESDAAFPEQCISETDKHSKNYILGPAKGGLNVSQYLTLGVSRIDTRDVHIDGDTYIPVLDQAISIVDNYYTIDFTRYEGVSAGLINPQVFVVPEACKNPYKNEFLKRLRFLTAKQRGTIRL